MQEQAPQPPQPPKKTDRIRILIQSAREVEDNPNTPAWIDTYQTMEYVVEQGTIAGLGRKLSAVADSHAIGKPGSDTHTTVVEEPPEEATEPRSDGAT